MYFLLSVPAAILPVLIAVFLIWWLDRYDREPLWAMAVALFWGATFAIAIGIVGTTILSEIFIDPAATAMERTAVQAVWLAPFVEEFAKIAVVLGLLLSKEFDNATDGFVYGATAGLGFAMTENFLYFNNPDMLPAGGGADAWVNLVLMRNFLTSPMHAVASASLGACLGAVKFGRSCLGALVLPFVGLIMAITIHVTWNHFMVGYALQEGEYLLPLAIVCLLGEIGLAATVFFASLHFESRMIAEELTEECQIGLIPEGHASILASFFQRSRSGWAAESRDVGSYVQSATRLAFLKRHWRRSSGASQEKLGVEIQGLRQKISDLRQAAPLPPAHYGFPPGYGGHVQPPMPGHPYGYGYGYGQGYPPAAPGTPPYPAGPGSPYPPGAHPGW